MTDRNTLIKMARWMTHSELHQFLDEHPSVARDWSLVEPMIAHVGRDRREPLYVGHARRWEAPLLCIIASAAVAVVVVAWFYVIQ